MKPLIEKGWDRWNELPQSQRYPHNKLFDNWAKNPHRAFKVSIVRGRRDDPYDQYYDTVYIFCRGFQCYYKTHQMTGEWRTVVALKLLEMRSLARRKALKNQ